jgi:hypothetical protein
MGKIALLGDSIFDNKVYTGTEPDVSSHLKSIVSEDWEVNLLAVDGSTTQMVESQLENITSDVTHVILSVGGNDALSNADILSMPASSAAQVLNQLAVRSAEFSSRYEAVIDRLTSQKLPVAVCTIYYPNFSQPELQRIACAALSVFNDVILREAVRRGLPIIDLRLICDTPTDYANEIEPSGSGGRKIANVIYKLVNEHQFSKKRTVIYH